MRRILNIVLAAIGLIIIGISSFSVINLQRNVRAVSIGGESDSIVASRAVDAYQVQQVIDVVNSQKNLFKHLGWWGEINADSVPVMEGSTTQSKQLGQFSTINRIKVLEEVAGETINGSNLWYKIDGGKYPGAYVFSQYVDVIAQPEPPNDFTIPDGVKEGEYWVDVNLTKKILTLYLYDKPVFATYVAIGRTTNPTVIGTYRIWWKLRKDRMVGGPPAVPYYYNLPNVPYVMYYHNGYGLHGTYWHDEFGSRKSAGCTNLTQGDAKYLFNILDPVLPADKNSVLSSAENPGTVVYNHY